MIDGEVPETVMEGQASNISHICEFSWYLWVMFCDGLVQYPADNLLLGRYLGPARYVGPAMTSKILKASGEGVCRYTLCSFTLEERENPAHIELRRKFTESYETVIGPKATPGDFTPDEFTPEWEIHKKDDGQEGNADAPRE